MAKLTKKQMAYLELLLDPTVTMTKEDMAKTIGVSRSTLWRWETETELFEKIEKEGLNMVLRHLGGIYTRLTLDALQGDKKASEQIFKYILKMDSKTITHNGDMNGLSDEELEKQIKKHLAELEGEEEEEDEEDHVEE